MSLIDSGALTLVRRTLRMAGAGSPDTDLDDAHLSQVLDVNKIVRRSRALIGTTGEFMCILQNVHAAADVQESSANPYQIAAGDNPPFPNVVPSDLDFWVLWVTARIQAGTAADFTRAVFQIQTPSEHNGFGINQAGVGVISDSTCCMAHWDSDLPLTGANPLLLEDGGTKMWVGTRIRRGATLEFISEAGAANGVTLRCNMCCALLPAALGQDIAL